MLKTLLVAAATVTLVPTAQAAEPGAIPVPQSVVALSGCWSGRGAVMGKSVTITINAHPIVLDAMFAIDADSIAVGDSSDRYAAHLVFGGAEKRAVESADAIMGFWADSFGGAFAATGSGESVPGGFDISYHYGDNAFVNRWRNTSDGLTWQIIARDANGKENPFASYMLRKATCPTPTAK
jgi:hypothetical protein